MHERNQFQKAPFSLPSVNRNVFSYGMPGSQQSEEIGGESQTGQTPTPMPVVVAPPLSPTHLGNAGGAGGAQGFPAPPGLDTHAPPTFHNEEREERESRQQRKRKRILGLLLGSILLVLVALGYVFWNLAMDTTPSVTLYQVSSQSVSQDVGGGGIVYPRQQLDISYPVAERIIGVMVKPGDQVKLNQPLIQLDPSLLNAQVQQASDDMAAAKAYLNAVSTSGNAVTIAQAQQAYNLAKNKYDALVAQASSPLLRNGNLIAPMSGIVTEVNVNPGEVFAPDTTMLTLMDESVVIAHVKVPLANLGQIHLGQTAQVTPSALPGQSFQGTVTAIIPQADPQTDTFEVWIAVANPEMSLLSGMSVYVRIQSSAKAMAVPRLAVLNAGVLATVFVMRGTQVYEQAVHVVGRSFDRVIIDKGLSPGDKVVLVGLDQLRNGTTVHVTAIER